MNLKCFIKTPYNTLEYIYLLCIFDQSKGENYGSE